MNERGFTLLESIVVLFIVVLALWLPSIRTREIHHALEEEWFFNELDSRLQTMQTLAIVSGNRSIVTIYPTGKLISYQNSSQEMGSPLLRTMHLPKNIHFFAGNVQSYHYSGTTGNVSAPLTIRFLANNKRRDLTIQLGSGRHLLSN